MTTPWFPALAGRLVQRVRARLDRARRDEGGFILLESVIAITLITVIMGAVGAEYVVGVANSSHARMQNLAAQLADSQLEQIRGMVPQAKVAGTDPTGLLTNRKQSDVTAEYQTLSAMPNVVRFLRPASLAAGTTTWDPTAYAAYDSSVTGSPTVPTSPTTPANVGSTQFKVYSYLQCAAPASGGSCVSTATTDNNIQAIVAVTWPQQACVNGTCAFVTSTLINDDPDPTFDLKQPAPALPIPQLASTFSTTKSSSCNPGNTTYQVTVAVNDPVLLPLGVASSSGVPPFFWTASQLPSGLSIADQSITGTVGGSPTPGGKPICTTLTVRDAFDTQANPRSGTAVVEWTVESALTAVPPTPTGILGTALNVPLAASGGGGTGYSYALDTSSGPLPPGLAMSTSGVISGTPTRTTSVSYPNAYPLTVDVTDPQACPACNAARTTTMTFNFTIDNPPLALATPTSKGWTIGTALSAAAGTTVQMVVSGGDGGPYTWAASGLPSGIGIDNNGLISGTPAGSGSGTASVTVTDPGARLTKSVTFGWTLYAPPTITTPGRQTSTAGGTVSGVQVSARCYNAPPCRYSAANLPSGLAIDPTSGAISGTVSASATTSTIATVTVTDAAGASATSSAFAWTILGAPTITGPGAQSITETATHSYEVDYTCPTATCSVALTGVTNLGLGLNTSASGTGTGTSQQVSQGSGKLWISGTVSTNAVTGSDTSKTYQPTVTITTTDSASASTSAVTWTAYTTPTITAPGLQVNRVNTSPALALSASCPNTPCTYTLLNGPPGLSVNSSGVVTGSITGSSQVYTGVKVSVSDADNDAAVTSTSFTWAVTTTFTAALNNVGVTKSSNRSAGTFDRPFANTDNAHHSYSAESATPTGSSTALVAGTSFAVNGNTYVWPSTAGSGSSDNIAAAGQVLAYSGTGSPNIGFLLASHNGNASGTVTIGYTDGSTSTATLGANDWTTSTSTYAVKSVENSASGSQTGSTTSTSVYIYDQKVPVAASKRIAYIALPSTTSNPTLHVFGLSQPTLAASFNTVGIASSSNYSGANLDGSGNSISYTGLTGNNGPAAGDVVTVGGVTYTWPTTAGTTGADDVKPTGQVVPFSATGGSTLGFLVTSVNGSSSGTGTITYSDNSTSTYTLAAGDWVTQSGYSVAFTGSGRYSSSGAETPSKTIYVDYVNVAVSASKTITSITLPNNARLRVFAIGDN